MNIQPQQNAANNLGVCLGYTGQILFNNKGFVKQSVVGAPVTTPNIFPVQRKEMMLLYGKYVEDYEARIPLLNKAVREYNAKVKDYIETHDLKERAAFKKRQFNRMMGKVSIEEYNQAAQTQNLQQKKPLLKLKKHIKVSESTSKIFQQIIFEYAMQIAEKNKYYKKVFVTTRSLQKMQCNLFELANKTNEVGSRFLRYDERTIQRHLFRLVDAGVLFDYEFKGYYHDKTTGNRKGKPSEYFVNSDILRIHNGKTKKTLSLKNQLYSFSETTTFTNINTVNRTYINKIEVIEVVNKQHLDKEKTNSSNLSLIESMAIAINKNPREQSKEHHPRKQPKKQEQVSPAENFTKNEAPVHMDQKRTAAQIYRYNLMEFMESKIEDKQILLEKYAEGAFKNYRFYKSHKRFLSFKHLEHEAKGGMMRNEDYLELATQILFKVSGNLYRKANEKGVFVYPGDAHYGYVELKNMLLTSNGCVPKKETILHYFKGVLWRLEYASRCFNSEKSTYNPWFPSKYFDPTRKTAKSGGFAYTKKVYIEHLSLDNHKKTVEKRRAKQNKEAAARNERHHYMELIDKKYNLLKNNKLSLNTYIDYLTNTAYLDTELQNYGYRKLGVDTTNQC